MLVIRGLIFGGACIRDFTVSYIISTRNQLWCQLFHLLSKQWLRYLQSPREILYWIFDCCLLLFWYFKLNILQM